ncbi:MAG: F0F1 ATP synthase subunit epsilon [Chloroflexi bacterium HGW-Chloroflexi-2]|jgi:F-type H+-transporting ATPase subunit epsilon|nr:MAG: F0F1 ATP synthase subunit epsilon [Chloroflexi bacterium HGW-Chloroflexi-2]
MNLKILLPTEVFLETKASKIVAEAGDGFFGLLPRHVDFVSALVPGIFTYWDKDDNEIFMAIDSGLLVKYGQNVLVSTRNAVCGQDLDELETLIDETFNVIDEQDRTARRAVSRMEADFIRRLVEIG